MSLKNSKLSGKNPLAYKGINPVYTTDFGSFDRDPTSADNKNFNAGFVWLKRETTGDAHERVWILSQKVGTTSTWTQLPLATDVALSYVTDSGTAVAVAGVINYVGDGTIFTTSCSGATATLDDINGLDGQLIIGGGAAPNWAYLTSSGGTITITNAANSINLESTLVYTPPSLRGDAGAPSPVVAGTIDVAGGTNIDTTSDNVNTLFIALSSNVTLSGTLTVESLNVGVAQTNSSGLISSNNGLNGQVLIGGGTAPSWANITSSDESIIVTSGVNTIDLSTISTPSHDSYSFLANHTTNYTLSRTEYLITLGEKSQMYEVFDNGDNFYPGDGAGTKALFTAPVAGTYFFSLCGSMSTTSINNGYCYMRLQIITTSRTNTFGQLSVDNNNWTLLKGLQYPLVTHLDANDTVYFKVGMYRYISSNPALDDTAFLIGTASPLEIKTFVSGYLIKED